MVFTAAVSVRCREPGTAIRRVPPSAIAAAIRLAIASPEFACGRIGAVCIDPEEQHPSVFLPLKRQSRRFDIALSLSYSRGSRRVAAAAAAGVYARYGLSHWFINDHFVDLRDY